MVENKDFEEKLRECESAVDSFEMFKAYEILEDDLKAYDKNPRALVCEGKVLASLNKIDEAIEKFSECISLFKEHREAYVERGYYRARKGAVLEGYLDLKKALEIEDILDGKLSLAKCAMTLSKYEEARDIYKELLNRYAPITVQSNYISSNKYIVKSLEDKRESEKLTLREHLSLGKSYMYLNKFKEAFEVINEVYDELEAYDDLILSGWIFNKCNEFERGHLLLDRALSIRENGGKGYLFKGIALENEGDLNKGYKMLKEGILKDPYFEATYVNLARLCLSLGKYNEGIKYCEKSMELNFKEYYALYLKACFLNRLGKWKEALKNIEKSLSIYSNDGDFYAEKSYALRNLHMAREANDICEEAFSYGFDTEKLNLEKGLILKDVEYYENAITWFDAALALNPRCGGALFYKIICQNYLGDYKGAISEIENMRECKMDEPLLYGAEFLIYYTTEDYEECTRVLKCYGEKNKILGYRKSGYKLVKDIDSTISKLKLDSEYINIKEKLNEFINKA